MTLVTPEERFRQLAEMEDGMPVSTGGRSVFFDLTAVPEAQRPAVIAELQEVIRKATPETAPAPQLQSS
jgi:hypothetical protein